MSDAQVKSDSGRETTPAEMDDAQFLRYSLNQLRQEHKDWPAAKLLIEGRKAMFATKAKRERTREEAAEALARKAAQERGELPPG
ncbi:MAG: hypothetical protein ABSH53_24835 [Holophaga sp.]